MVTSVRGLEKLGFECSNIGFDGGFVAKSLLSKLRPDIRIIKPHEVMFPAALKARVKPSPTLSRSASEGFWLSNKDVATPAAPSSTSSRPLLTTAIRALPARSLAAENQKHAQKFEWHATYEESSWVKFLAITKALNV